MLHSFTKQILFVFFLTISMLTKASPYRIEDNSIGNFEVPNINSSKIAICFWDQREQVVDKSRPSAWMGYLRGGYGNVFGIVLESGNAFSNLLNDRLQKAFSSKGIETKMSDASPFDNEQTVINKLTSTKCEKLVLIKMIKMMVDGFGNSYYYNVSINVSILNSKGELIDSRLYNEQFKLGNPRKYKNKLPESIKSSVYNCLNNAETIAAFNIGTSATTNKNLTSNNEEEVNQENKNELQSSKTETATKYDIIVTKKGDEIEAIVEEISEKVIKYKNKNQPSGPVRIINTSDVFMIKYKDGTKEVIK
jgi:hypothetical protein